MTLSYLLSIAWILYSETCVIAQLSGPSIEYSVFPSSICLVKWWLPAPCTEGKFFSTRLWRGNLLTVLKYKFNPAASHCLCTAAAVKEKEKIRTSRFPSRTRRSLPDHRTLIFVTQSQPDPRGEGQPARDAVSVEQGGNSTGEKWQPQPRC